MVYFVSNVSFLKPLIRSISQVEEFWPFRNWATLRTKQTTAHAKSSKTTAIENIFGVPFCLRSHVPLERCNPQHLKMKMFSGKRKKLRLTVMWHERNCSYNQNYIYKKEEMIVKFWNFESVSGEEHRCYFCWLIQ